MRAHVIKGQPAFPFAEEAYSVSRETQSIDLNLATRYVVARVTEPLNCNPSANDEWLFFRVSKDFFKYIEVDCKVDPNKIIDQCFYDFINLTFSVALNLPNGMQPKILVDVIATDLSQRAEFSSKGRECLYLFSLLLGEYATIKQSGLNIQEYEHCTSEMRRASEVKHALKDYWSWYGKIPESVYV